MKRFNLTVDDHGTLRLFQNGQCMYASAPGTYRPITRYTDLDEIVRTVAGRVGLAVSGHVHELEEGVITFTGEYAARV